MVGIDRESGFVVGDVFLAMASLKERAGDEVDVDVIDGVDGVEAKRVERDRGGEKERSSRRSRVSKPMPLEESLFDKRSAGSLRQIQMSILTVYTVARDVAHKDLEDTTLDAA